MSVSLTHLLGEYISSQHRPACTPDGAGVFTFDAGEGMLVCANELGDDCTGLFASPGYMSATELACVRAGEDDLERWQADGAAWSVHLDRTSGLVTLAGIRLEAPWDLALAQGKYLRA